MVTEYPGNAIPAPGYRKGNNTVDEELLYSTVGYTQKGVTLKAGQGVLLLGTVLARETSTKRYVKYASGGANGTGEPVGVLRQTVDTGESASAPEYQNNVVIKGILQLAHMQRANSGTLTNAVTALNGRADSVLGTFTF